jgi:endonuclease III related protein
MLENKINNTLIVGQIYDTLFSIYGPQGWWPLLDFHDSAKGINPTKTGSLKGYHPGLYHYPKSERQLFEVCVGAILTQSTSWPQVEKVLINLRNIDCLEPKKLIAIEQDAVKLAIKPAGYFNQKYKKLIVFSEFFIKLKGRIPERSELIKVFGIGEETADSILLYGYRKQVFVVDAYTKRIFERIGLLKGKEKYSDIKRLLEENLKTNFKIYQEYHALLVEHAKRFCKARPDCTHCPLKDVCKKKLHKCSHQ